jgi:hypothetical protein
VQSKRAPHGDFVPQPVIFVTARFPAPPEKRFPVKGRNPAFEGGLIVKINS